MSIIHICKWVRGIQQPPPPFPAGKFKSIKLNPHGKITTTTKLYAPDPPPPTSLWQTKTYPHPRSPELRFFWGFFRSTHDVGHAMFAVKIV